MADGNWIMAGRVGEPLRREALYPGRGHQPGRRSDGPLERGPAPDRNDAGAVPRNHGLGGGQPGGRTDPKQHGRSAFRVRESGLRTHVERREGPHLDRLGLETVCRPPFHRRALCGLQLAWGRRDGFRGRETLAIGVSRPGELAAEKIWRVQDRTAPDSPTAFHYPCAIEHEGRLLVLYTTGRTTPRQCELAIIPIASLQLRTAEPIRKPNP